MKFGCGCVSAIRFPETHRPRQEVGRSTNDFVRIRTVCRIYYLYASGSSNTNTGSQGCLNLIRPGVGPVVQEDGHYEVLLFIITC